MTAQSCSGCLQPVDQLGESGRCDACRRDAFEAWHEAYYGQEDE